MLKRLKFTLLTVDIYTARFNNMDIQILAGLNRSQDKTNYMFQSGTTSLVTNKASTPPQKGFTYFGFFQCLFAILSGSKAIYFLTLINIKKKTPYINMLIYQYKLIQVKSFKCTVKPFQWALYFIPAWYANPLCNNAVFQVKLTWVQVQELIHFVAITLLWKQITIIKKKTGERIKNICQGTE